MSTPPSPTHPPPFDIRNNLDDSEGRRNTLEELELNPSLQESSEDEATKEKQVQVHDKENEMGEEDYEVKKDTEDSISEAINEEIPNMGFTPTFEEAYESVERKVNQPDVHKLSESSRSNLINDIDELYLQVQRKFVKNQAGEEETYSIYQLVDDLSSIFDLVWSSVNGKNGLFGQDEYAIKLLLDLEEFVSRYELFEVHSSLAVLYSKLLRFFSFLQSLDTRISFLVDGFTKEGSPRTQRLNRTQIVRISTIVARLRSLIVYKMDNLRLFLRREQGNLQSKRSDDKEADYGILLNIRDALEVEVSRLFEGLLERF